MQSGAGASLFDVKIYVFYMPHYCGSFGWAEQEEDETDGITWLNTRNNTTFLTSGPLNRSAPRSLRIVEQHYTREGTKDHMSGHTSRVAPKTQRAFSYMSDEHETPLAIPIPRRDRLLQLTSAVTRGDSRVSNSRRAHRGVLMKTRAWSGDDNADSAGSVGETRRGGGAVADLRFVEKIWRGLNSRAPERSSYVLRHRCFGTMLDSEEGGQLPMSMGAVRLRQEHVSQVKATARSHRLTWLTLPISSPRSIISLVRNAVIREMSDMQRIMHSLELRKYDVCSSDVHAFFAWFKVVENLVGLYFAATEIAIYGNQHVDMYHPNPSSGVWYASERQATKMAIISLADKLDALRRPLIALNFNAHKLLAELRKRADTFAKRLVRFLDDEVEHVEAVLMQNLNLDAQDAVLAALIKEIRSGPYGRDIVMVLAQGLSVNKSDRNAWVKNMCNGVNRLIVQLWMKRLADRHWNFVSLFESAGKEYQQLYDDLARDVDDKMASVHSVHKSAISSNV